MFSRVLSLEFPEPTKHPISEVTFSAVIVEIEALVLRQGNQTVQHWNNSGYPIPALRAAFLLRKVVVIIPTVDNLRNFLLTPTKEMVSFLAAVNISLNANRTTASYV